MIVVADTSVLLNLCQIREEDLLWQLYGEVAVPAKVKQEFERAVAAYERFERLAFPCFIHVHEPKLPLQAWLPDAKLDAGESDAIALTMELQADLLLMDERKGRRAAASLGISVSGILGMLIQAKQKGFVSKVRSLLIQLKEEAGFFLSDQQTDKVLALACEIQEPG